MNAGAGGAGVAGAGGAGVAGAGGAAGGAGGGGVVIIWKWLPPYPTEFKVPNSQQQD